MFVTVLLQLWGRTLYSFGELLIIEFLLENNSAEQNSRYRVIELTCERGIQVALVIKVFYLEIGCRLYISLLLLHVLKSLAIGGSISYSPLHLILASVFLLHPCFAPLVATYAGGHN